MKRVFLIKYLLMIALLLLHSRQASAVECSSKVLKNRAVYSLPGSGYWMQAAGDCRIIYTSVGGLRSKLFNICQNKSEQITFDVDASPIPGADGDLYVHPRDGIKIYKLKDSLALTDIKQAQPIYQDSQLQGNYESVGLLKGSTPENRTVRIAMGNVGGTFRDYKINRQGDNYTIAPVQSEVVWNCKNLHPQGTEHGLDKELPVLSRDGEMISGREYESRKTQIFRIEGLTGKCTPIRKIPYASSKVSFTFDNKSVLYVVVDPNTRKGRLIQMDIASGVTTTLSGPDEDVMYMTAKPNGNILYTRRGIDTHLNEGLSRRDQNREIDNQTSDLIELDMRLFSETAHPKIYEALGLMWGAACEKELDLDYALAVGQRFDAQYCQEVVTPEAVAGLDVDHKEFSFQDLMEACKGQGGTSAHANSPTGTAQ